MEQKSFLLVLQMVSLRIKKQTSETISLSFGCYPKPWTLFLNGQSHRCLKNVLFLLVTFAFTFIVIEVPTASLKFIYIDVSHFNNI